MHVTVHKAQTQLSRLIEAALAGEDVVIFRGDAPVVRLQPIPQRNFVFGLLAAELGGVMPNFLEPLDEAELRAWEAADKVA